jgi:hypothetical protein
MQRGGQNYYFHPDDLGSVAKVTDQTGAVVEQYQYGDYGVPSFFNGGGGAIGGTAIGNPYLFRGMRLDAENGFYISTAWSMDVKIEGENAVRHLSYFDPRAGRALTHDSMDLDNNPASRNYCVQYRETAFNFVSRLMEEEGIFYYFNQRNGAGGVQARVEYLSDEYFKLLCRPDGGGGNGALAEVEYLSDEYFKLLCRQGGGGGNGALAKVEYLSDEYFKLLCRRGAGGNGALAKVEYLSDEYFKFGRCAAYLPYRFEDCIISSYVRNPRIGQEVIVGF